MGTRAIIQIDGIDFAEVYKHWDGDPPSTLRWLQSFNRRFSDRRGEDPNYKFAQLLRSSIKDADLFGLDTSVETGWGVVPAGSDMYQEYTYRLHTDGSVTYESH